MATCCTMTGSTTQHEFYQQAGTAVKPVELNEKYSNGISTNPFDPERQRLLVTGEKLLRKREAALIAAGERHDQYQRLAATVYKFGHCLRPSHMRTLSL